LKDLALQQSLKRSNYLKDLGNSVGKTLKAKEGSGENSFLEGSKRGNNGRQLSLLQRVGNADATKSTKNRRTGQAFFQGGETLKGGKERKRKKKY